jgi:hypothetical protein
MTISYEIYMLDDDGKPIAKVATIDEDGKPAGFAGSIADWAYKRAKELCIREASRRPGEHFGIDRVTRERLTEMAVPRGYIDQIEVDVTFTRDPQ